MGLVEDLLDQLKKQIEAGFLVSDYKCENGYYNFILPALEYSDYQITIPENLPGSKKVKSYISSSDFADALLTRKKVGVILIDLVKFSDLSDEIQLKLLVRYQTLIRKAIKEFIIEQIISIGDGSILIFSEEKIRYIPNCLLSIINQLEWYNKTFFDKNIPPIRYRIGVNVGTVYSFRDINKNKNCVGPGINIAQRISTCVTEETKIPRIYLSEDAVNELKTKGIDNRIKFIDKGNKKIR